MSRIWIYFVQKANIVTVLIFIRKNMTNIFVIDYDIIITTNYSFSNLKFLLDILRFEE